MTVETQNTTRYSATLSTKNPILPGLDQTRAPVVRDRHHPLPPSLGTVYRTSTGIYGHPHDVASQKIATFTVLPIHSGMEMRQQSAI